jgi:L-alanine-DL-glutamate epimerase-like enolase superfamily enzyme
MKITAVDPFRISLPYEHGAPKSPFAFGTDVAGMEAVYVRVATDEGIIGWGEAFGFGGAPVVEAAVRRVVAPLAIGRDPRDIDGLTTDIRRRSHNMGHNGPMGFALSGFDIALWDIAGKVANKPVHQLLGSTGSKQHIPAYASLLRLNTPDNVRKVCGAALARGYRHIKLHECSVDAVAAAREAVGAGYPLMLDTNCAWDLDQALDMARKLKPFNLTWLEEPTFPPNDYRTMAQVRRQGGVPVAAGENLGDLHDIRGILEAEAVDFLQPDATKMGGITALFQAVDLARDHKVVLEPHSPLFGPGLIATLHVIAAVPDDMLCEFFYADLEASPLGDIIYPGDGFYPVPAGPGLGITVDESILKKYAAE